MKKTDQIKTRFEKKMLSWQEKNAARFYITMHTKDTLEFAHYALNELQLRLITISGVDTPQGIELLYHYSDDGTGAVISMRTLLEDAKHPAAPSLTGLLKASAWIEREIHELLGVEFTGHPNPKHLLLGEDWPQGEYPLRQAKKTESK